MISEYDERTQYIVSLMRLHKERGRVEEYDKTFVDKYLEFFSAAESGQIISLVSQDKNPFPGYVFPSETPRPGPVSYKVIDEREIAFRKLSEEAHRELSLEKRAYLASRIDRIQDGCRVAGMHFLEDRTLIPVKIYIGLSKEECAIAKSIVLKHADGTEFSYPEKLTAYAEQLV